jgi:synaptojanin
MHLYLVENPRALYLVTSSQEEGKGRPRRALVFRAAEENPYQAVVEFLHKDQVNLANSVRLTSRVVKGCLGLICVGDGTPFTLVSGREPSEDCRNRSLPFRYYVCHRGREH